MGRLQAMTVWAQNAEIFDPIVFIVAVYMIQLHW
jgi:hypothetical protein